MKARTARRLKGVRSADSGFSSACAGKICYRTTSEARMGRVARHRTEVMSVYQCPHCGFFHLGHRLGQWA